MTVQTIGMLNTPEIILILVLALILFGAKKLPDLAKGLGHGIREFRKASREVTNEIQSAMDVDSPSRPYQSAPARRAETVAQGDGESQNPLVGSEGQTGAGADSVADRRHDVSGAS